MSEIPDDIATIAIDVLCEALTASRAKTAQHGIDIVARAILAERKRCADIARTVDMYDGDKLKNSNPRETIAAAINSGEQP